MKQYKNWVNTSTHITKKPAQLSKHPHITQPTHTHTHTLHNPHIHTPTHFKTHTYAHPRITKQVKTATVQDTSTYLRSVCWSADAAQLRDVLTVPSPHLIPDLCWVTTFSFNTSVPHISFISSLRPIEGASRLSGPPSIIILSGDHFFSYWTQLILHCASLLRSLWPSKTRRTLGGWRILYTPRGSLVQCLERMCLWNIYMETTFFLLLSDMSCYVCPKC